MKVLIDADSIIYKSSAAVEQVVDWEDGVWSLWAEEEEGKKSFLNLMAETLDGLSILFKDELEVIMCVSSYPSFRSILNPEYKKNRQGKRRPLLWRYMNDFVSINYNYIKLPFLEGDDVLGLLYGTYRSEGEEIIIVTEDKDLKTIPNARLFNPYKSVYSEISSEEAALNFYTQIITGDQTDCYIGCKGVGGIVASRILNNLENKDNLWRDYVLPLYKKSKQTEEDAILNARMAYILCQRGDYDLIKKEVNIWTPEKDIHQQNLSLKLSTSGE